MADLPTIDEILEEDDPAQAMRALLHLIQSGETVQGALCVRLVDGTGKEFTFGCDTDAEREQALALLHSQLSTKH